MLYFNGIDGARGGYFEPPVDVASLARRLNLEQEAPWSPRGLVSGIPPESLADAGWGVIFPHDVRGDVVEALAPLLDLRQEQAERPGRGCYRRLVYRPRESWLQFLRHEGVGPTGPVDPSKVPYYLLIVGGPRQIPFAFQYQLGVPYAVGRLDFETADEYARYAETVVAAERGEAPRPRRAVFFGVKNQDDTATGLCQEHLVEPLAGTVSQNAASWETVLVPTLEATKERLHRHLGGPETPALLFVGSHGLMFRREDPEQRETQGALVCHDWPGPKSWPGRSPEDHYFAAADLADAADVAGQVVFSFACFSAGTPRRDSFSKASGDAIRILADEPFVAALPQRLLGHPRGGALAFIGHIDQAWHYSFLWQGAGRQIQAFESAFYDLMTGKPIGLALESFAERYATLAMALSEQCLADNDPDAEPLSEEERDELNVQLWMSHNDARAYVLLGDPAVRVEV